MTPEEAYRWQWGEPVPPPPNPVDFTRECDYLCAVQCYLSTRPPYIDHTKTPAPDLPR